MTQFGKTVLMRTTPRLTTFVPSVVVRTPKPYKLLYRKRPKVYYSLPLVVPVRRRSPTLGMLFQTPMWNFTWTTPTSVPIRRHHTDGGGDDGGGGGGGGGRKPEPDKTNQLLKRTIAFVIVLAVLNEVHKKVTGPIETQDPETLTGEEREKYLLSRRRWHQLIVAAPDGSIAAALQVIAGPLYTAVGELGGVGIGKTFEDNLSVFYSETTLDNVVKWAEYETAKIQEADYTDCWTKLFGSGLTAGGRAWVIWYCHCSATGKLEDKEYVNKMSEKYPWDKLEMSQKAAITTLRTLI